MPKYISFASFFLITSIYYCSLYAQLGGKLGYLTRSLSQLESTLKVTQPTTPIQPSSPLPPELIAKIKGESLEYAIVDLEDAKRTFPNVEEAIKVLKDAGVNFGDASPIKVRIQLRRLVKEKKKPVEEKPEKKSISQLSGNFDNQMQQAEKFVKRAKKGGKIFKTLKEVEKYLKDNNMYPDTSIAKNPIISPRILKRRLKIAIKLTSIR